MPRRSVGSWPTSCPSMRIIPASGVRSPRMHRNRVVFPPPDGPKIAANSPSCSPKDRSFRTPWPSMDFLSPRTSRVGMRTAERARGRNTCGIRVGYCGAWALFSIDPSTRLRSWFLNPQAVASPGRHELFGGPGRARPPRARRPQGNHRERIVRRDRLPPRWQHVRRRSRRRPHRANRAVDDGGDAEGTRREAVRPLRSPRDGGLAPRRAGGIPNRGRPRDAGVTRGRVRLLAAEETDGPEAVSAAAIPKRLFGTVWLIRWDCLITIHL